MKLTWQIRGAMVTLPKTVDIIFEEDAWTFILKLSYYNPRFIALLKEAVGSWGVEYLPEKKAWRLWAEDYDKVKALIDKYLGGRSNGN